MTLRWKWSYIVQYNIFNLVRGEMEDNFMSHNEFLVWLIIWTKFIILCTTVNSVSMQIIFQQKSEKKFWNKKISL